MRGKVEESGLLPRPMPSEQVIGCGAGTPDGTPDEQASHRTATMLPELVERCLARSLSRGGAVPREVRLTQAGCMWLKPGGRALRFTATENLAVDRVAFSWTARFPLLGRLGIDVIDGYADGEGALAIRFLGLPVQTQQGRETTIGEALRYLAELPWAPHAMMHNPELEWRKLDERTVEVATRVAGERLPVRMELDESGDIVRTSSHARLLKLGRVWRATPWAGEFRNYAIVESMRIPTEAEVYWELEDGRFVYWHGVVTGAELLGQGAMRPAWR